MKKIIWKFRSFNRVVAVLAILIGLVCVVTPVSASSCNADCFVSSYSLTPFQFSQPLDTNYFVTDPFVSDFFMTDPFGNDFFIADPFASQGSAAQFSQLSFTSSPPDLFVCQQGCSSLTPFGW